MPCVILCSQRVTFIKELLFLTAGVTNDASVVASTCPTGLLVAVEIDRQAVAVGVAMRLCRRVVRVVEAKTAPLDRHTIVASAVDEVISLTIQNNDR